MQKIIMAVDDETSVLRSLNRMFRNKQYHFIPFDSPVKAIAAVAKLKPHIIISDQNMPYIHGIDFLLRAQFISKRSLRIMLTGFEVQTSEPKHHIDRIIMKPWENEQLEQEVMSTSILHDKILLPVSFTDKPELSFVSCLCGYPHVTHEVRFDNFSKYICLECQRNFLS